MTAVGVSLTPTAADYEAAEAWATEILAEQDRYTDARDMARWSPEPVEEYTPGEEWEYASERERTYEP